MIEVYIDGSSRGNGGVGGIAIVIVKDGIITDTISKHIGDSVTNNEAEYSALVQALTTLSMASVTEDVYIFTDSSLVCGQMTKGWKINFDHLRKLNTKAKELIEKAEFNVTIEHVGRDNNKANDAAQDVTAKRKGELSGKKLR